MYLYIFLCNPNHHWIQEQVSIDVPFLQYILVFVIFICNYLMCFYFLNVYAVTKVSCKKTYIFSIVNINIQTLTREKYVSLAKLNIIVHTFFVLCHILLFRL